MVLFELEIAVLLDDVFGFGWLAWDQGLAASLGLSA